MNKSIHTYLIALVLLTFLSTGCDHETDTFDGPNLVDRFGDFTILDNLVVSRATVDFSAGETVFFTATFNKSIDWVIVITGMESGAVKRIEGFSTEINEGNATWTGGTTDLPFFKLEQCSVELVIPEEPDFTGSGEVEVVGTKVYEGSLFTDFETDLGTDLFLGNFEFELTNRTGRQNDIPAAQGDWYYLFEGTDNVVSNFFVGLIRLSAGITGETYIPFPTTVPEDLYFNSFLYADGGPHGIAVIQFFTDSNDNGAFDDGVDQSFQLAGDFPLTWEGWRHINHPMSEIGISQAQLEKIVAIQVLLISDMNAQPNPPLQVDFGLDFITFTSGGPLEL